MKALTSIILLGACMLTPASWATCDSPIPNIQISKPDSRYNDHFDGTVTDLVTGLTWAKCSVGQTWVDNTPNDSSDDLCNGASDAHTWKTALDAAQNANTAGYLGQTDWRLPNVKELESLLENACWHPSINAGLFPSTPTDTPFWSSSPLISTGYDYEAWIVTYATNGQTYRASKSSDNYVRLVRKSQ